MLDVTNRPKSPKSHSKSVFISKSLAVAFIAFYNRAEQSQSIVFLSDNRSSLHFETKKTKHCEVLNASHWYYKGFSFAF